MEIDADKRLKLTLNQNLTADVADDTNVSIQTDVQYNDMGFYVSSVRLHVSTVEPPKGYLENVVKQMNSGRMNFDFVTFTD